MLVGDLSFVMHLEINLYTHVSPNCMLTHASIMS